MAQRDETVTVEGKEIRITKPDTVIWPIPQITKLDYVKYAIDVSPYLLPYTKDRMLNLWRYPEGVGGKRIEERSVSGITLPEWLQTVEYNGKKRVLLNDAATLAWAANRYGLEIHVPFDTYFKKDYPTMLVFDLDPSDADNFDLVREIALETRDVLQSLGFFSVAKTSGGTGLQIYVPVINRYTFEETRMINTFIADYLFQRMPGKITLERVVGRRGQKLYFDYLQLWKGRTMIAPYAVRARDHATVSAPVTWDEVERGFLPADFTLLNMRERIARLGDLFAPITTESHKYNQSLDEMIGFIRTHA
ncbi:non-homologous end-joining DNA ligase [Paenibacillus alkalitolerans]|uniref:non-homologous end-joining DNA ligase n=1 Tax=Paenibacillus alkalitolerans TaxID=2799335 RepID=UPI0018F2FB24|nr:non-homologous end-joining DNA ligase [Paenibacillus alkalitolerans]